MRIAISAGDPSGVGPEVIRAALRRLPRGTSAVVFGDESLQTVRSRGRVEVVPVTRLRASDRRPGNPTRRGALAQFAYVEAAVAAVERREAAALVTAPVSKAAISRAGRRRFVGHTEWLAERAGLEEGDVAMAFVGGPLTVVLATSHVPLARVTSTLTIERIVRVAEMAAMFLRRIRGSRRPRLRVAALNPHAGEGGLLGEEERRVIRPAVLRARQHIGCEVVGPVPADAVFHGLGRDTAVVALHHDQAMIPVKLLSFGSAVNVTLGLPYLRASAGHGVGYDIAGKGVADAGSMTAAVRFASRFAGRMRRIPWTTGLK